MKLGRQLPATGDTILKLGTLAPGSAALDLWNGRVLRHHRGDMSSPSVTATFLVKGMHCASCGILIDDVIEELDGVSSSATSVRRGRTVVKFDPNRASPTDIGAAIVSAGSYEAELVGGAAQ